MHPKLSLAGGTPAKVSPPSGRCPTDHVPDNCIDNLKCTHWQPFKNGTIIWDAPDMLLLQLCISKYYVDKDPQWYVVQEGDARMAHIAS